MDLNLRLLTRSHDLLPFDSWTWIWSVGIGYLPLTQKIREKMPVQLLGEQGVCV